MLQQMKALITPEDESWKFKVRQIPRFSPDISILEQFESQLLFVPDDLQAHHKKHELIVDDILMACGHAFTKHTFTMWKKDLGEESYPLVLKEQADPYDWRGPKPGQPAQLYGELYLVKPSLFYKENGLDNHRQNTVQFQRRRIKLEVVHFKHIDRPWFRETSKWTAGALSRTEKLLDNPEEAERLIVGPLVKEITAWMYMGVPEYWNPQIIGWSDNTPTKENNWGFPQSLLKPGRMFRTNEGLYYYNYTRDENP